MIGVMTILGTLRFTTFKLIYYCEELTSELRMILVHAEVAHVSYLKLSGAAHTLISVNLHIINCLSIA